MKHYTICLYNGNVETIDHVLALYETDASDINSVDYMNLCFDYIKDNEKYPDFKIWAYKNSGEQFTCYYCRALLFSEKIISVDFGSHSNFIAIIEGDHKDDCKNYFNGEIENYYKK